MRVSHANFANEWWNDVSRVGTRFGPLKALKPWQSWWIYFILKANFPTRPQIILLNTLTMNDWAELIIKWKNLHFTDTVMTRRGLIITWFKIIILKSDKFMKFE